jgi:hypothetical protein
MALSVFLDKSVKPDEQGLAEALGDKKQLWDQLKAYVKEIFPDIIEDWKHYGKNSGWTMKLLKKKRNLFFSYPGDNEFTVVFVFGDKAVQAIEDGDFPRDIVDTLKAARKYAEGRGLKVTIDNRDDVETVKKLIDIKVKN